MRESIEVGYQVFVSGNIEEIGAVRDVTPKDFVIWVENAGDFTVPLDAVVSVRSQKVTLNVEHLDDRLREAIGHAHDAEDPGV